MVALRAHAADRPRPVHETCPSVHSVLMPSPADRPLRCPSVSQTPIYHQLCSERLNADVPAPAAEPEGVGQTGKHRLAAGESSQAAPPGRPSRSAADRAVGWSWFAPVDPAVQASANPRERAEAARETAPHGRTYPSGQPAGSDQGMAPVWGPHAAIPPASRIRHHPAAADSHGAHRGGAH